jgi:NagD protein
MYLIDVQGTLIDDKDRLPISGSIEFIKYLNQHTIPYVIITNNTKHASDEFLASLIQKGLPIKKEAYLDPFTMLEGILDSKEIAAFGVEEFKNVLKGLGYNLNYTNPKYVVVSVNKDYTSDDFALMIELLLQGAQLVGMHETTIYSKENKRYPGVGAIMKMLSFATNKPYQVVGKPSKAFYEKAKQQIGAQDFTQLCIISDDMKGDIVGAIKLGMKGIFVLSGKIKTADEIIPTLKEEEKPQAVYPNIGDFFKSIT